MAVQTLSISYTGDADATVSPWVNLEQQPVSGVKLTENDLQTMLALVRAGISARTYRPASCEAYLTGENVVAELGLYVFPSSLDLAYTLESELLAIGQPSALSLEREFDLVVGFDTEIELPFIAENIQLTWQTDCYSKYGVVVDLPEITAQPTRLAFSAEVFGVLRVRCNARGYLHPLTFAMSKASDQSITDIQAAVEVAWHDESGSQYDSVDIELPLCLEALLAACGDGTTITESVFGSVNDDDETVPFIYYSPCSGRLLTVRNERP